MVGALLRGEVVAITLAVLVLGFGGMFIALFASQTRATQKAQTAKDGATGQGIVESRRPQPVGRLLHLADPLAVGAMWFCLGALVTGSFFHSPGVTVAEHVTGGAPPTYLGQPEVTPLLLGVFITFLLALALAAMASKVSPVGR